MQKQVLLKTRETAVARLEHYKGLLGITGQETPAYSDLAVDVNAESALPADTIVTPIVLDVDVKLEDLSNHQSDSKGSTRTSVH